MKSRSPNIKTHINLRALLLVVSTSCATWLLVTDMNIFITVFITFLVGIQGVLLVRSFNQINRKVAFFFEAIENDDTTLHFSQLEKNSAVRRLNESLNRINRLIQSTKEQQRHQEQFYQLVLEQVDTGIIICNTNGNVVHANRKVKKLFDLEQFTHLVQLKRKNSDAYQVINGIEPGERQLLKRKAQGSNNQLSLRCAGFTSQKELLRLISVHDIRSELDENEANAWIRLIRVLTHEIMNSIAPITSLSETILSYYKTEGNPLTVDQIDQKKIDNTIEGLEIINERGINLIDFVNSYRVLTRIPVPVRTKIPVSELIDKVRILVSNEPGVENANFQIPTIPAELSVVADENQITHVLINLMKNAIEATVDTPEPVITIEVRESGSGKTTIAISDNGAGIPPEVLEQIFVPFFTTKTHGSGIGLSFSRQVIRMHNGVMNVDSAPGKGTTVTVTI
ncbi:MAG: ATP-binding protein [Salinivirgaceae bacterium]|jgi:two-component system nitrogen regulation sensor histidine kinase NtrY|nr:ATP-binding protein [Salinivirgaceae bacterium]